MDEGMASRRALVVVLGALVGCNAVSGAADLVADLDGGAAPEASATAPPPPAPLPPADAGSDAGDDAADDFVPFDGADASGVKIVFVTSQTVIAASLGGVAGGDSACMAAAA